MLCGKWPSGAKAHRFCFMYVRAEARTLQGEKTYLSAPQGLKARTLEGEKTYRRTGCMDNYSYWGEQKANIIAACLDRQS